jgi:hypothetical protein
MGEVLDASDRWRRSIEVMGSDLHAAARVEEIVFGKADGVTQDPDLKLDIVACSE